MEYQRMPPKLIFFQNIFSIFGLGIITVFFTIIPHLPDFSPQLIFFLYLGSFLPKKFSALGLILVAFLFDLIKSWLLNYPIFGSWTIFTYSFFVLMSLSNHYKKTFNKPYQFIFCSFLVSLFFWLWTNFGVWALSGLYELNKIGFLKCYSLALPFLENSLMAAIFWSLVIILYKQTLNKLHNKNISSSIISI